MRTFQDVTIKQSDFLIKIIGNLLKLTDFNVLIRKILKSVKEKFGLQNCGLLLLDKDTNELYLENSIGFEKGISNFRLHLGEGVTGKAATSMKTIYVPDVSKMPNYVANFSRTKSELAIPLIKGKTLLGILNFEKKKKNGFSKDEITLLKSFSTIVSISLVNALLFENLKTKEKQHIKLIGIARKAGEATSMRTVFGNVVSMGGNLLNANKCAISLYDKETGMVRAQLPGYGVSSKNLKTLHYNYNRKEKSLGTKVIRSQKPYLTNDAENDPIIIKRFVQMFSVKRLIVSPLKTSKEVIGVFYIVRVKGSKPFTNDDVKTASIFSSIAAAIIKRMQTVTEVKKRKLELEQLTATLKQTNEELQSLSFSKTNLISNISHELRTPLVSIKGFTDLLVAEKFGELNEKQKLSLFAVKRNSERLIGSIDNLVEISDIELGSPVNISSELLNLPSVLDSAIELVMPRIEESQIHFSKKYNCGNLIVEANREKLLRAFVNIMDNAVKFNKRNGKVHIRCYEKEGNAVVEIRDTGIGIPKKYQKLIFNRFFQVDSSAKRGFGGAGIGLSLSLEIINFFNGKIKVSRKGNQGTVFTITLPVK